MQHVVSFAADDLCPNFKIAHMIQWQLECISVLLAAWGPVHEMSLSKALLLYVRTHELLHIGSETGK